jgi:hypothetical protein
MPTLKEPPMSTQRARMRTPQNQMLARTNPLDPHLRRLAPSQENHTLRPLRRHDIYNLLRELLPPFVRVRVGVVGADGEAEAVGLVVVVVGVLAEDYGFYCGEGGVAGPVGRLSEGAHWIGWVLVTKSRHLPSEGRS